MNSQQPQDLVSAHRDVHNEFSYVKLTDLNLLQTLGVGGFGRVELVRPVCSMPQ